MKSSVPTKMSTRFVLASEGFPCTCHPFRMPGFLTVRWEPCFVAQDLSPRHEGQELFARIPTARSFIGRTCSDGTVVDVIEDRGESPRVAVISDGKSYSPRLWSSLIQFCRRIHGRT